MLISWNHGGTLYNHTGTLPCVDFMDVILGDIPYITALCLNGPLPCVDFMDVIMGGYTLYNHAVFEWDTSMC